MIINQAGPAGDRNPSAATENRKCTVNEGREGKKKDRGEEEGEI